MLSSRVSRAARYVLGAGQRRLSHSFLSGTSSAYINHMYTAWKNDPSSVHTSWDAYFSTNEFAPPPAVAPTTTFSAPRSSAPSAPSKEAHLSVDVLQMIRAFQVRGQYEARLDPLEMPHNRKVSTFKMDSNILDLSTFGISPEQLTHKVDISANGLKGFQDPARGPQEVGYLFRRLKECYTKSIGVEFMHIANVEMCNFIREQIETPEELLFPKTEQIKALDRLMWSDHFEQFLAKKYPTAKRFGIEGAESLIPGMKSLIDEASQLGVTDICMGMPHRGRLNVLSSVVRKPLEHIFSEFMGGGEASDFDCSGDVKYHLGMSHDRPVYGGKTIHLSLAANPSHLEAVNPVVTGKVRAKQVFKGDSERSQTMALLLHGDSAFAGQGVVYETMGLAELDQYSVGGTIHIVVNNQIGFTTDPVESRSSMYCTDIAKAFSCPVFHVNGDDVEAVIRVCRYAAQWRQKFKKDCVIDLVCYRKYGHNETDEPSFTQPLMYEKIAAKTTPLEIYKQKLIADNVISEAEYEEMSSQCYDVLNESFEASKVYKPSSGEWLSSNWADVKGMDVLSNVRETGVTLDSLKSMGESLLRIPDDFVIHKRLKRIFEAKRNMFASGVGIDWGTAESLAFGSLLLEGVNVRLSGQDVERGTFSHRHAVLHCQKNFPNEYVPLEYLATKFRESGGNAGKVTVCNSSLSEFGVLGFELGYSLESPNQLVLWEAQFGDFANGAQVIFDQFFSSGEAKWMRQCGLTVLLPHGYEGMGPEHSSCRLERFLQFSADDDASIPEMGEDYIQKNNIQVLNCSTPAQYFHALRRQLHRDFRKPLVIATPKMLLRLKAASSTLEEMGPGTRFRRGIMEQDETVLKKAKKVRKLVICSGKWYYDLLAERERLGVSDIALCRIEQIAPFPFDHVQEFAKTFPNAELIWSQEEPKNQGAWTYVSPRFASLCKNIKRNDLITYMGRAPSASTATGFGSVHQHQVKEILADVFA